MMMGERSRVAMFYILLLPVEFILHFIIKQCIWTVLVLSIPTLPLNPSTARENGFVQVHQNLCVVKNPVGKNQLTCEESYWVTIG